jgi:hypothetical protein
MSSIPLFPFEGDGPDFESRMNVIQHPLHPTAADSEPSDRWTMLQIALLLSAMGVLLASFTNILHWANEQGISPVKPRDFNLTFGGLTILFTLLNRPSFSLPALGVLIIPLTRLMDAALLQRFTNVVFGDHMVYVLMLAGYLLTSFAAVFFLPAVRGDRIAIWVATLTVIICALVNVYEWLGFDSYTRIPGRMSGWHVDPNHSPIIMCMMFGILFTLNKNYWWNMALVALAAIGIALTMSRSGMAVFLCMTSIYMLLHFRERYVGMIAIAVLSLPVVAVGVGVLGATSTKQGIVKNEDTSSRMQAIYELDFEKLKSPERAKDLADGWEAVGQKPVFGWGTGAGGEKWQPHNQFVTQWLDLGLPGVLLFAGILLALTAACALRGFSGGFCLIPVWLFIPCSQILLETPAYWMCLAVGAMAIFPGRLTFRLSKREPVSSISTQSAHA